MKKFAFVFCFFSMIIGSLYSDTFNRFLGNPNSGGLYSLPELYEKTVESTVLITGCYDSRSDKNYSNIYCFFYGDQFYEKQEGTGFIYSKDGYIVTNFHVIESCNYFKVHFFDDTVCQAELVGYDERTDLAVLKVNKENLIPLILQDEVEIGQWIYTVGNPLSLYNSLSIGIVAGKQRYINYCDVEEFIQLDLNANPGNSGGPVLSLEGKVIGVVAVKFDPCEGEGICFAIPSEIIKKVSSQLIKNGKVDTTRLGLKVVETEEGYFKISAVESNSLALRAGLKIDDLIVEYDGFEMISIQSFYNHISLLGKKDILTLKIFRDNEYIILSLKKE